ncbi:MAG: 23S rRNA (adenine2503-C2)-methyltransferase [Saprospiraceae bacterium]|jgi:23S rRNA (adenine2503-C2)-methyltransferase
MKEVIAKLDIRKLAKDEIKELLISWGESKFRAKQIFEWLWLKGAISFDEMTNLSKDLRQKLSENFEIRTIQEDVVQNSADGTIKTRYTLHDDHKIEAVLIPVPDDDRYTVCVSSQVGCSLTCKFCATGQMKRMRNLDPGEIYDQVRMVNEQCLEKYGHRLTNIVYMGMGEPLLNYANVMESIQLISSEEGLGFSPKRVTISTAGIAKMIRKLADDNSKVNLALSLHAADDAKRDEIMPINEQNNLKVLMESLDYYYRQTRNKLSYEYITFKGYNDSEADARNLVKLCKTFPVLINIIEYNPIEGVTYEKSDPLTIDDFASYLRRNDVMVTVRKSRGKDIDAACGQLANK